MKEISPRELKNDHFRWNSEFCFNNEDHNSSMAAFPGPDVSQRVSATQEFFEYVTISNDQFIFRMIANCVIPSATECCK